MKQFKIFLFLFAVVASSSIVSAQEWNATSDAPPPPPHGSHQEPPEYAQGPSNQGPPGDAQGPGRANPFNRPQFNFPGSYDAGAPGGPRQKRSVVSCDYEEVGLLTCTSCNTVQLCSPEGRGIVFTCGGFFPYCRNGRCSPIKGALCGSSSTSTSTTTETDPET